MAVPTGLAEGAPMGIQLMASQFEEERLLVAAEAIELRAGAMTPIGPAGSAGGPAR
jgi:amidase